MTDSPIETHFEDQGSLEKPKIIGRLARFAIGAWLLYQVYPLIANFGRALEIGLPLKSNILVIGLMLWVLPYIVNIGWSLNSKRMPQIIVIALTVLFGVIDYLSQGVIYGTSLKAFTLLWILYAAAHLGISFVLSALLATPGCEMRAIPQLWALISGRRRGEHYCPGIFNSIDRWERGRDSTSKMQK